MIQQQSDTATRIAFVGEAMAELMLGNDESQAPALGFAGDTMNTAIYLNRILNPALNASHNTSNAKSFVISYITNIGNDSLSDRLIRRLNDESIDTSRIGRSSDRLIGLYAITTDESGERAFSYWRSESAARTLFQNTEPNPPYHFEILNGFNVIFLSAISLAILPKAVRMALLTELDRLRKEAQVNVVFDSNYRPALWESRQVARDAIAAAWRITDIALPSIDDERMLFADIDEVAVLERLRSYGIVRGALKRGALGPLSLSDSAKSDDVSLHQTVLVSEGSPNVVDTTAAGDSFNAGYLSAIFGGKNEQEALQAGHACALRVIAHRGAIIPMSDW